MLPWERAAFDEMRRTNAASLIDTKSGVDVLAEITPDPCRRDLRRRFDQLVDVADVGIE